MICNEHTAELAYRTMVRGMLAKCADAGVKRLALAEMLGVKLATVNAWAKQEGKQRMSLPMLLRVLADLRIPVESRSFAIASILREATCESDVISKAVDLIDAQMRKEAASVRSRMNVSDELIDVVDQVGEVARSVRGAMDAGSERGRKISDQERKEMLAAVEKLKSEVAQLELALSAGGSAT
jgi:transcriptional regulator with XRE-family HTH domain